MAILIDERTRFLVQGITGRFGRHYAPRMRGHGTQILAGVSPGHGGEAVDGIPVYNTVADAQAHHPVDAAIVLVPGPAAQDALLEAAEAGLSPIVALMDGMPIQDMVWLRHRLRGSATVLIGPNSPGLISPGRSVAGFIPPQSCCPGPVGILSRSGTLTYQTAHLLKARGIGQSTAVGIGGDPVVGTSFVELLQRFQADPETEAVVLIGEVGGTLEEEAAAFIRAGGFTKPVVAFIAGRSVPVGRRMGHAGALVMGRRGTHASKVAALQEAGVAVASLLTEIPSLVAARLRT